MTAIVQQVIEECSKGTGLDAVFSIGDMVYVISIEGESRVVDTTSGEVNRIDQSDANTIRGIAKEIKMMPIEDSKKSILGHKIYKLDNTEEVAELLHVWHRFNLDMYAYSVDYDLELIYAMLEYMLIKVRKVLASESQVHYADELSTFLNFSKEMAMSYCYGVIMEASNPDNTDIIDKILESKDFEDLFINAIYKTKNKLYIFFEEENKSVVVDLVSRATSKLDESDIEYLESNMQGFKSVGVPDDRASAISHIIATCLNDTGLSNDNLRLAKLRLVSAVQLLGLDDYFCSVSYESKYCEKMMLLLDFQLDRTNEPGILKQIEKLKQTSIFKELESFKGESMAVAYAVGYWDATQ